VLAPDGATGMGMRRQMAHIAGLIVRALPRLRLVFVGLGVAAVASRWPKAHRAVVAASVVALAWHAGATARMAVVRAPQPDSAVYRTLAGLPEGVLLELPLSDEARTYREPEYVLYSTHHWKMLINGYSGHTPPTYVLAREIARGLPSPLPTFMTSKCG